MPDKVIVTNLTALKQKYGAAGVKSIQGAVKDLIKADKGRGLATTLVALDDATAMKKLKATPVKNADSYRENKKAIDGVYKALVPDYLVVLGAIDVVPHQDLKNPLYTTDPNGDNDEFAYSDVPYACDAPYSQDIKDFTGPTRVVGRLPDLSGAQGSPKYLIGLLKTASSWKSSKRSEYQNYLGVSAETWLESTAESLTNLFGSSKDMQTSPKKGYVWKTNLINRRMHFINCHGGDAYPNFLGQSVADNDDYPVSHMAAFIGAKGNIAEGTVVAAECCYGGQLYDPSNPSAEGQMSICNTYLAKKAYAFFGSTTTAYGPSKGNDQADLICQYFLQRVLNGASTGRATLEARQRFIEKTSPLSPMNQKTLAQFNLYGDPSVVPVDITIPKKLAVAKTFTHLTTGVKSIGAQKGGAAAKAAVKVVKAAQEAVAVERSQRRKTLRAKGTMLSQMQPEMSRSDSATPKGVESTMKRMMGQLNFTALDPISFAVQSAPTLDMMPKNAMAKGITKALASKKQSTTAFHVMFGTRPTPEAQTKSPAKGGSKKGLAKGFAKKAAGEEDGGRKKFQVRKLIVLEAKEVDGKIVSISEAHSK
jgi:hypothetical protein